MKKVISLATSILLGITMTACSSNVKGTEVVATVNGKDITVSEYEKSLSLNKQAIEAMYGSSIWDTEVEKGVKYRDTFKQAVLSQLISTEVQYGQAEKEKLVPSQEELDKAFKEYKESIEDTKTYEDNMKKLGITEDDIKEEQKIGLAIQKYQEKFAEDTKISDEDIKKYYDEHKDEYHEDKVKASHILIKTTDDAGKELPEKKQEEAKKKAEDILKKVQSGEDFAKLAKEYSDDKGSAENGGDLDYFTKGKMVKEFENAAWSLKKGEVSELVKTSYGYHIIKVTDKVDKQLSLDEVKDSIKGTLLKEKYIATVDQLVDDAKVKENKEIIEKVKF